MKITDFHVPDYTIDRCLHHSADAALLRVSKLDEPVGALRYVIKTPLSEAGSKMLQLEKEIYVACKDCHGIGELLGTISVENLTLQSTTAADGGEHTSIIMPFYPHSLSKRVKQVSLDKNLDIRQLCLDIANALSQLHSKGYAHGDLHPDNVLFDTNENVRLIDFSLAGTLESQGQADVQAKQSHCFRSPEQIATQAGDVYSLCVLLSYLIFHVLESNSENTLLQSGTGDSALWLESTKKLNNEEINALLEKGTALSPQTRPSLDEFKHVLERSIPAMALVIPSANQSASIKETGVAKNDRVTVEFITASFNEHIDLSADPDGEVSIETPRLKREVVALKNAISAELKQEGYIEDTVMRRWCDEYLAQLEPQVSLNLVETLIKREQKSLSRDSEYAAFFEWTKDMRGHLHSAGKVIEQRHFNALLARGLSMGAGKELKLKLWLLKRFNLRASFARRIFFVLSALVSLACIVALIVYVYPSVDGDKPEPANIQKGGNAAPKPSKFAKQNTNTVEFAKGDMPLNPKENPTRGTDKNQPAGNADSSGNIPPSLSDENERIKVYSIADPQSDNTIRIEFVRVTSRNSKLGNFYVMRSEVSQAMWQICVNAGACRTTSLTSTSKRRMRLYNPNHPVVNVSWYDVSNDFIPFLEAQLNQPLSLPNMSQWLELAFDESGNPNLPEAYHCIDCKANAVDVYQGTSMPVSPSDVRFKSQTLGLYHLYGNAQEWLQDCWQDVKLGAARCDQAPAVGGSWQDDRSFVSKEALVRLNKNARSISTGFRLVHSDF
ncbi:protein kinase domain-containing protein [Ningiella sp. W23]|uniref:protein kinase domain-containing protein n=1 Tax=Ningiella sp. W23 TaxID=3023715 RepID=UPI003756F8BF